MKAKDCKEYCGSACDCDLGAPRSAVAPRAPYRGAIFPYCQCRTQAECGEFGCAVSRDPNGDTSLALVRILGMAF